MAEGEAILAKARLTWEKQIGAAELARLESHLAALVGDAAIRIDAPGSASQD